MQSSSTRRFLRVSSGLPFSHGMLRSVRLASAGRALPPPTARARSGRRAGVSPRDARSRLPDGRRAPTAAREEARRRFGNVTHLKEQTRDMWTFPSLESFRAGHPLRAAHAAQVARLHLRRRVGARRRHRRQHRDLQPRGRDPRAGAALSRSRATRRSCGATSSARRSSAAAPRIPTISTGARSRRASKTSRRSIHSG